MRQQVRNDKRIDLCHLPSAPESTITWTTHYYIYTIETAPATRLAPHGTGIPEHPNPLTPPLQYRNTAAEKIHNN